MEAKRKKIIDRIVNLFNLGGNNPSEQEMMLAVTRARQMMAEHQVSMAEIELAKTAGDRKRIQVVIEHYPAYTRAGRNLAHYDHCVAQAVGTLTDTRAFLRTQQDWITSKYHISMMFMGAEADVALAGELFLIWLGAVRKMAYAKYGAGKNVWGKQHTAYAVGVAARLNARAAEQVRLSTPQAETWALVLASKSEALARAWDQLQLKEARQRKIKDEEAFARGWTDGGSFDMNKKIIPGR